MSSKGTFSTEINLKFGLDFLSSVDVLSGCLPTQRDKEQARDASLTLLTSYKSNDELDDAPDKGGDENFAAVYPLIQTYATQFGPDAAMEVLEAVYKDIHKYATATRKFGDVVGLVRVLDAMLKDK